MLAVTSLAVSAIGDLNLMIRIQVTLMMKRWRLVLGNMKHVLLGNTSNLEVILQLAMTSMLVHQASGTKPLLNFIMKVNLGAVNGQGIRDT